MHTSNTTPSQLTAGTRLNWVQGISILLIGLGIGWLAGLSVSPVVTAIVTSLLGIIAGVVASLKTLKQSGAENAKLRPLRVDALPAALLVVGIALAVPMGIVTRTHHLLEPAPEQSTAQTTPSKPHADSTTPENDLQRALVNFFDRTLQSIDRASVDRFGGAPSNLPQEQCDRLAHLADRGENKAFIGELKNSSLPYAKEFASRIDDVKTLRVIVDVLCEKPAP